MSVELLYQTILTATEILEGNPASAAPANRTVRHTNFNTSETFKASTSVPVTKAAYFEQVLSAGAATIDLTALTGTNGASVDGTGLKVQAVKFKAAAGNGALISVTPGAVNGYDMFGSDFKVSLSPGQEVTLLGNELTPDIAVADAELDLAGTGSTDKLEVSIVMG